MDENETQLGPTAEDTASESGIAATCDASTIPKPTQIFHVQVVRTIVERTSIEVDAASPRAARKLARHAGTYGCHLYPDWDLRKQKCAVTGCVAVAKRRRTEEEDAIAACLDKPHRDDDELVSLFASRFTVDDYAIRMWWGEHPAGVRGCCDPFELAGERAREWLDQFIDNFDGDATISEITTALLGLDVRTVEDTDIIA